MIIVVADDLSGAAELAGAAQARGLAAEVQTIFDATSDAGVVAIDTDTRGCSSEEAFQRVTKIARRIMSSQPEWIYKKTDSVLRGHVVCELTALLAATGKPRALLIPANPSRGRVIRDGAYYIGDVPLDRTVFACDPDYPARSSRVLELLNREKGAALHRLGRQATLDFSGIGIPDVDIQTGLEQYAVLAGPGTLCAGAVEFFKALLDSRLPRGTRIDAGGKCLFVPKGRTLIVCGSAAAWHSRRQECNDHGVAAFVLPPEAISLAGDPIGSCPQLRAWAGTVARELAGSRPVLMAIGEPRIPRDYPTSRLTDALARAVALVLASTPVDQVLLEGGATASAVLRVLQWTRLAVRGPLASDLAALQVIGAPGPLLGIKPGSYSWPENIWPDFVPGRRLPASPPAPRQGA